MFQYIALLCTILACVNAEITLQDITSKPASRTKDFMIWQYFKQDITPAQADKAFYEINNVDNKLFRMYAEKCDREEIKYTVSCMNEKNLLSIVDEDCLELAMSPYKTVHLTNEQRKKLSKSLKSKHFQELLSIQSEPYTQKAYEKYDANTILSLFVQTTASHRRNHLNIDLDKKFMQKLTSNWKIGSFIELVVNDDTLDKLQNALSYLDGKELSAQSNFILALHHLQHSNKTRAMEHLELTRLKSTYRIDVDKSYFWMYKISNNKDYLNELLLSMDINIYTLYAHEVLDKDVDNYFSSVETVVERAEKNLQDPFQWNEILKEIRETTKKKLFDLASSYKNDTMKPVQAFIIEKAYNYKIHSYIMPYNKYLKDISIDAKALVYAIMKQESHLIPSALSRSYALGLMQLMPFLVDAMSKKEKNAVQSYEEMFIPQNNLNYAKKHLEWIQKSLYHPLFIAYAYNGGMGFTRRYLESEKFTDAPYEPFLSMELMKNSESREYGKKVLANYVMYKKILGEEVSIVHLFDILTQPKKTDRFRG